MDKKIILITGTTRGIGLHLVKYYTSLGHVVIGCSRSEIQNTIANYQHHVVDISDEQNVKLLFRDLRKKYGKLDVLINNAGIASMNHSILTTMETVHKILDTNVAGTFLFCREAAKLMQIHRFGRIVNFATVATSLKTEGVAIYAASKAAVISLTQILSREFSDYSITVNAIGPTPVKTDLIKSVPTKKIEELLESQAISRYGEFSDIDNVIDFFIKPESDFITGQVIFLGGI